MNRHKSTHDLMLAFSVTNECMLSLEPSMDLARFIDGEGYSLTNGDPFSVRFY